MGNILAFLTSLAFFLICLILVKLFGAIFISWWAIAYIFMFINGTASALHWPFKRKLLDCFRFYLLVNSVIMLALLMIQVMLGILLLNS